MSTVKEDLLEAAEIIEQRGWCRGNYMDEHGRVCLMAALSTATGRPGPVDNGRLRAAVAVLKATIPAPYLAEWNDQPGRTKDEVLTALREAAKEAS